jgi:hypothetical protein
MSIFNNSKYTTWYMNIINSAKNRSLPGYTEKHHITPKCLGGDNSSENLVRLTAREHYVCHLLLTKMTDGMNRRKMLFALWRMVHGNKSQERYQINSKQYETIKRNMAQASSEQNKGKKMPEHLRLKMIGKPSPLRGRKLSEETKEKMRIAAQKRKVSDKTKDKISNSIKKWASKRDPKMSEETKLKMSKAKLGKKRGPQSEEHKRNQSEAMKLAWLKRKSW